MDRLLEPARLHDQRSHEVFRQYLRYAGNVEDVLLGIQRRELSAGLRKRVDDLRRHLSHTGIKQSEKPRGPPANDRDVLDVLNHQITIAASGAAYTPLASLRNATRHPPLGTSHSDDRPESPARLPRNLPTRQQSRRGGHGDRL